MLKARGPRRIAERRPPYPASGSCDCPVCREREQLRHVATWHPQIHVRMLALTFMDDLHAASFSPPLTYALISKDDDDSKDDDASKDDAEDV